MKILTKAQRLAAEEAERAVPEPAVLSLGESAADVLSDLDQYMGSMHQNRVSKKEKMWFEVVGPLSLEDLMAFNEVRANGKGKVPSAQIKTIRTIHHQIAQYMSQGLKNVEIAAVLGISQSRISLISNDPAFEELMEYYTGQQQRHHVSIQERLNTISTLALEEMQDRLLDNPEEVNNSALLKLIETTLDRSGHQPGGKSQKEGTSLSSDEISAIKDKAKGNSKTEIVSRSEYISREESHGADAED